MISLENKTAIVTGAAMGMGKATALKFAKAGANVIVADMNEEEGQKTVEEIKADGGEATFVKVNVAEEASVKEMVQKAVDTYGSLDVAINNAAITPDDKPIADMDFNYYEKLMSVDLNGVALCLKYELAQMEKDGTQGSIINTSSVSGIRPQPTNPAYVAAKHGVIGLTKQAAMDYSPKGIRINSVAPGAIDTPMLRGALDQFGFDPDEYAKQLSMLGRFAQADEVAEANLWLASDLSSYVTGTVLNVDGGYTSM
ncbi:SDR family NAD(P)-dependent oxidoreductase [Salinicoccus sp. RF5]|uniref:SDR family NAD(P)-dependent oxidoreductase n=1 Tax=Salinicoccus sp. RF5 TaxID=2748874 RepID=UPI001E56495A|nr:glucose 1-dehydrogenase [Salinicoccus sp. RF5]MCC4723285.1 SDR family oxidoreductase [Salinicoccus sp. RF5]